MEFDNQDQKDGAIEQAKEVVKENEEALQQAKDALAEIEKGEVEKGEVLE